MANLHCHYCQWSQDDYWDESYNPIRRLLILERGLLTEDLDESIAGHFDASFLAEIPHVRTWRDYFAWEIERSARIVRAMRFRTEKEHKRDGSWGPCPICGQRTLDVD
jgi:hypothetical protein